MHRLSLHPSIRSAGQRVVLVALFLTAFVAVLPLSMAAPGTTPPSLLRVPLRSGQRLLVIGDLHGDLRAFRRTLKLATLINDRGHWIGGDAILVQLGDQLDRGPEERPLLDALTVLQSEANAAGGMVYPLLGNHEVMNVSLQLHYVPPEGWAQFRDIPPPPASVLQRFTPRLLSLPRNRLGRAFAFLPGGLYARRLSEQHLALIVGETLFVHGGLPPDEGPEKLARLNQATRRWMRGEGAFPERLQNPDSVIWDRRYSADQSPIDCAALGAQLERFRVRRLVVAHTVQPSGVNARCAGRLWRADVGLSRAYGGQPQALELTDGIARVLGALVSTSAPP